MIRRTLVIPLGLPACAIVAALLAGCTTTTSPSTATDAGYVARLESLALLQTLRAELLSNDSATATLERWCATHGIASPPRIVADRVPGSGQAPSAEQRALLEVTADELVRHRRVQLRCGEVVMSGADNWYVPSRLTPAMNHELDTSDTPFGRVVQPLQFRRRTLSSEALWHPLPDDWAERSRAELGASAAPPAPASVLQQRAVLTLPDGRPISLVIETYTGQMLTRSGQQRVHR